MDRFIVLIVCVLSFPKYFTDIGYGSAGFELNISKESGPTLTRGVPPMILPADSVTKLPGRLLDNITTKPNTTSPNLILPLRDLQIVNKSEPSDSDNNRSNVAFPEIKQFLVLAPIPPTRPIRVQETLIFPADFTSNGSLDFKLETLGNHVCGQNGVCLKEEPFECETFGFQCQPCKCDRDCFRYRDCCLDMYANKSDLPPSEELPCTAASLKRNRDLPIKRYYMVNSCPMEYASDGDDNLLLCERDPSVSEPVYSPETDKNYKNKHCAACNGIKSMMKWSLQPVCRTDLNYSYIDTPDAFLQEALYNSQCDVLYVPPNNSTYRECLTEDSLISTCPEDDHTSPDNAFGCKRFLAPIRVFGKKYRNIFCAACNGETLGRFTGGECKPLRRLPSRDVLSPISTIIHDTNDNEGNSTCQENQVFDTYQDKCRRLFCPPGKVIIHHGCQDLFQAVSGLRWKIEFVLTPKSSHRFTDVADLSGKVFNSFMTHTDYLFSYIKTDYKRIDLGLTYTGPDKRILSMTVTIHLVLWTSLSHDHLVSILVDFVRKDWYYYPDNEPSPIIFQSKWLPENRPEVSILDWLLQGVKNIKNQWTKEWATFIGRGDGTMQPSDHNEQLINFISITELSRCKQIQLDYEEFEGNPNEKITIKSSGEILEYGQFVQGVGDTVRVCTDFDGNKRQSKTQKQDLFNSSLQTKVPPTNLTEMITIACVTFSLAVDVLALVASLVRTKFQRTVCCNNLAFIVNVFITQLLLLLSMTIKVLPVACYFLGALLHYFSLSSFSWLFVCTMRLYYQHSNPPVCKSFSVWVWVVAQGLPIIIVGVYILVNYLLQGTPGYQMMGMGNDFHLCFISPSLGIVLGFIIPVALLFFAIIFLYVKTLYHTYCKKPGMGNVIPLGLFKLTLYFGMAWTFFVLAILIKELFLWYFFILIQAGVGIVMFLCLLNKKSDNKTLKQTVVSNSDGVFYSEADERSVKPPSLSEKDTSSYSPNVI